MARLKESRSTRPVATRPIPQPKEKPIPPPKKKPIPPPKKKPIPSKDDDNEGPKKRYRPGSRALSEIRRYQRGTSFLIPTASFQRLVRQLMSSLSRRVTRLTDEALECIQTASEAFLVQLFEDSVLAMINSKRVTLMVNDMQLIRRIRGI